MPTFEDPAADADEVQIALRALAHATRSIDDPRQILLGAGLAHLSGRIAEPVAPSDRGVPRRTAPEHAMGADRFLKGSLSRLRVSWDLHRAGEMLRQVGGVIGNAHEAEAILAYHRAFLEPRLPGSPADHGLSL